VRELYLVSGQTGRRLGRLCDLPGQAGGREGLVFCVREEGLIARSIRPPNGARKRRLKPPFDLFIEQS
jgi:hypothetical protein